MQRLVYFFTCSILFRNNFSGLSRFNRAFCVVKPLHNIHYDYTLFTIASTLHAIKNQNYCFFSTACSQSLEIIAWVQTLISNNFKLQIKCVNK